MKICKNCGSTISSKNDPHGKGVIYFHVEPGMVDKNYWTWNKTSRLTRCKNPEPE